MDLAARTAGPGVAHLPKIVFAAKVEDTIWCNFGHLLPIVSGFCIPTQVTLVVLENGGVQVLLGQAPPLGEQFPGPLDGFLFIIIAKGPVAQHLEKGVVVGRLAYFFQVIVLARDPHALLRINRAGVGPAAQAQENVFELVHAGVGEQQRGVVVRHQRGAGHNSVSLADKEIKELLANRGAGHFFVHCFTFLYLLK